MFVYPIRVQTPVYRYFGDKISTPNFGDHRLSAGEEFAIMRVYCADVAAVDPTAGAAMYRAWEKAGRPAGKYSGEAVAMENLLGAGDNFKCGDTADASVSGGAYRDAGVFVFRGKSDRGGESYFALTAPPKYIGHGHFDMGSFIIYKDNVPIVADPGIEGYFDSTKDWYVSSSAHSTVQFARRGGRKLVPDPFDICLEKTDYSACEGWNDTPRFAQVPDFSLSDTEDSVTVEIGNIEDDAKHIRNVRYIRDEDIYIVEDTVRGFDGELRWNLVTLTESLEVKGNRVFGKGYYGVNLEVEFLSEVEEITTEKRRSLPMAEQDGAPYVNIIRAVARGGFKTVIRPRKGGIER